MKWNRKKRIEELPKLLKKKILLLDGAMGTFFMIFKSFTTVIFFGFGWSDGYYDTG